MFKSVGLVLHNQTWHTCPSSGKMAFRRVVGSLKGLAIENYIIQGAWWSLTWLWKEISNKDQYWKLWRKQFLSWSGNRKDEFQEQQRRVRLWLQDHGHYWTPNLHTLLSPSQSGPVLFPTASTQVFQVLFLFTKAAQTSLPSWLSTFTEHNTAVSLFAVH